MALPFLDDFTPQNAQPIQKEQKPSRLPFWDEFRASQPNAAPKPISLSQSAMEFLTATLIATVKSAWERRLADLP